jgi:hypothetical protein
MSWRSATSDNPHIDPAVLEAERRRLPPAVFEQEFLALFEGEENLPCALCSGPSWSVSGALLTLDFTQEPRCRECGNLVDRDGHSIVGRHPDGSAHLFVIDGLEGLRFASRQNPAFDAGAAKLAFLAKHIPREPTLT